MLDDVIAFADPVLTGQAAGLTWDPTKSIWYEPRQPVHGLRALKRPAP